MSKTMKLAAILMVKNESPRIRVTLDSIVPFVDGLVVFDTGSEDDTVNIVKEFSRESKIPLHLKIGTFRNFAVSRNELLAFADAIPDYDYYLMMDSNDELVLSTTKDVLKDKISEYDCLYVHQKWHVGTDRDTDYHNIRIIKSRRGFEYVGPVHEYVKVPEDAKVGKLSSEEVTLFQDRTKDDDGKTRKRWETDVKILEKELTENPEEPRTQYYLAQTYACLGMLQKAKDAYEERSRNEKGFYEERFLSMMAVGDLEKDEYEKIKWYFKAYAFVNRAEPLVKMCRLFRSREMKLYELSFAFAKIACDLDYPENCTLHVDRKCYAHDRWQELSISAYYVDEYEIGKRACEKAIASGYDKALNEKNFSYYEKITCRGSEKP
jgi:glycosyltransferase involved in cell wall biosynthesis